MILSKVGNRVLVSALKIRLSTNQISSEYGARHEVNSIVELPLTQIYQKKCTCMHMYAGIYTFHLRVQRFASFQSCLLEL